MGGEEGWGRAGVISVTTSSELEQGSLVNPSVCDHGKQSRLSPCAGRTEAGFPDGKHWALGSTVQTLTLGGSSRGVQWGAEAWCKFFTLERRPVCTRLAEST